MKRIKMPEPIRVQSDNEKEPLEFGLLWFSRHYLNGADQFIKSGGTGIRSSVRIEDAIMAAVESKAPQSRP